MAEFLKINPQFINKIKPHKGEFPYGQELLGRSFFEKLGHNISPKGRPIFNELTASRREKWFEIINRLLPYITDEKLGLDLISQLLGSKDEKERRFAINYLSTYSSQIRHHVLYSKIPRGNLNQTKTGQQVRGTYFEKTGSQTVVFGEEYIGKMILRIVDKEVFIVWRKAFQSEDIWRAAGLDYVPVEPMVLKENGQVNCVELSDGRVAVACKVLGKNLNSFLLHKKNRYKAEELNKQADFITQILKDKLGIEHGHSHNGNFCVEEHDGKYRLYLIDFDRAKFLSNEDHQ